MMVCEDKVILMSSLALKCLFYSKHTVEEAKTYEVIYVKINTKLSYIPLQTS